MLSEKERLLVTSVNNNLNALPFMVQHFTLYILDLLSYYRTCYDANVHFTMFSAEHL